MKIRIIIRRIFSIMLSVALVLGLQRLVQPKYVEELKEGSFTEQFYKEKNNHQVLMVGDCELYENFDPITLWKNYGITSYIRGNAQQLAWQSYYLLKEALKYDKPEVVIFNVLELKYNVPQKEEYNRLTLENMKWSKEKVDAIKASMMDDEEFAEYMFPILRYHSRITQLTDEDFNCYMKSGNNTVAGYYMRIDTCPYQVGDWGEENYVGKYTDEHSDEGWSADADPDAESSNEDTPDDEGWSADADSDAESSNEDTLDDEGWSADADPDAESSNEDDVDSDDEENEDLDENSSNASEDEDIEEGDYYDSDGKVKPLGDNAMHYLDLIRELCEENNIKLLLVKAPSVYPMWHEEWNDQIKEYSTKYNLNYINYLEMVDELKIDFSKDTYDSGLHMNYSGAVKCANHLGKYLKNTYNLKDMHSNETISSDWEEKSRQQTELIESQQAELDEFGEIQSY